MHVIRSTIAAGYGILPSGTTAEPRELRVVVPRIFSQKSVMALSPLVQKIESVRGGSIGPARIDRNLRDPGHDRDLKAQRIAPISMLPFG
jgi:hypothetical protein